MVPAEASGPWANLRPFFPALSSPTSAFVFQTSILQQHRIYLFGHLLHQFRGDGSFGGVGCLLVHRLLTQGSHLQLQLMIAIGANNANGNRFAAVQPKVQVLQVGKVRGKQAGNGLGGNFRQRA